MKMFRTAAAFALAASAIGMGATAAAAGAPGPNPAQFCRASDNAGGYLGSHGGCVSSGASIGFDEVLGFEAFPSQAAAIANCKGIEAEAGGFPYYFYQRVGDSRYLATNYRTCVNILYKLHTGQLPYGPA